MDDLTKHYLEIAELLKWAIMDLYEQLELSYLEDEEFYNKFYDNLKNN